MLLDFKDIYYPSFVFSKYKVNSVEPIDYMLYTSVWQVEDDKILKISGEKRMKKEDNWHHYERSTGKFFTSFSLPLNCRADYVKSSMDNGVLSITVPKKEVSRNHHHVRTVQIN